jgi:hypothetical protein
MLTKRKMSHRSGSEGPRHDPYHYDEFTLVEVNDGVTRTVTLRAGLGIRIEVNGKVMIEGYDSEDVVGIFEELTGLSMDKFRRSYNRVHPYFEDPMGSLAMYE